MALPLHEVLGIKDDNDYARITLTHPAASTKFMNSKVLHWPKSSRFNRAGVDFSRHSWLHR